MRRGPRICCAFVAAGLAALSVALSVPAGLAADAPSDPQPGKEKKEKKNEAPAKPRESGVTESVVVSASATTEDPLRAPAAVDVLDAEDLKLRPGDTLVDQLRRVPGVNVVQFSARDLNIASRSATGGINNTTLVLADGRSLYQDFLGFVMWEFAPTDMSLVERVEVVRGPASALWGANAVGGLVHVITKSPRDTLGAHTLVEVGNQDSLRLAARESFFAGPWAVRVAGSFYKTAPFQRPDTITNFLGETVDPNLGLLAKNYRISGTAQPRVEGYLSYGRASTLRWTGGRALGIAGRAQWRDAVRHPAAARTWHLPGAAVITNRHASQRVAWKPWP